MIDASPDAAASVPHRGFPQVVSHGGHLLSSMRLVVITAPGDPLGTELAQFCQTLVTSQWWTRVTSAYGLGTPSGCVSLVGAAMASPATLDDTAMQQYIAGAIAAAPSPPQPDGQTMYLLYLPPGVQFAGNGNCGYSGYHLPYGTLGDGWGVVMRCQFDFSTVLESLTVVGSHEIVEAATDPDTAKGWGLYPTSDPVWTQSAWIPYGGGYSVEVGDFCIAAHTQEAGVWFQRVFDNTAAAGGDDPCVPAISVPYYNVTIPQDWYAVGPGQTVDIPITGWSTSPADPWQLTVSAAESSTPPPVVQARTVEGPTVTIGGTVYHQMTTGGTAVMHLTMASTSPSGSWRTFWFYSYRVDASGADGLAGDDHDHLWRVGVYVP